MWTCETCGEEVKVPVEGVNVITSREYMFCVRCVEFDYVGGKPVVKFPSPGKMIPETILEEDAWEFLEDVEEKRGGKP